MVAQSPSTTDLKQIVLFNGSFGPNEIVTIREAIGNDYAQFEVLRDAVNELESKSGELPPAGQVRLGVCQFLVGRYDDAYQTLKTKGDGGALVLYYQAKIHFIQEDYAAALKSYDAAEKAGYSGDDCTLGRAEVYRCMAPADEAFEDRKKDGKERKNKSLEELNKLSGPVEQTAEYLYQRGASVAAAIHDENYNPNEAIALYERAVQVDRTHPGALFGLAQETERRGNDEEALELYKRAAAQFPTNVGTLINLGLLYEDLGQYEQAIVCFQRVLDQQPDHPRARLFLKDARASSEMHFDEDAQRKRDRLSQVLSLPVSDFELSVRSRNCLKNMGIATLGDLCKRTEQELLASKNFGETSLVEIKEMLSLKELRLGQFATEKHVPDVIEVESLSPDEQAVLMRPVTDLNLSVRARKCMNRLGLQTISELIRRTADELLECKNFGVTSLKEVREKLSQYNLRLRGE